MKNFVIGEVSNLANSSILSIRVFASETNQTQIYSTVDFDQYYTIFSINTYVDSPQTITHNLAWIGNRESALCLAPMF